MNTSVIILAAGMGKRMQSNRPKVLQSLAGKPLIIHVLDSVAKLNDAHTVVVYGFGGDLLKNALSSYSLTFAKQEAPKGTGDAAKAALLHIPSTGKSLILCGDVPLIQPATLQRLLNSTAEDGLTILSASVDNPTGFGRIVRNDGGQVRAIVEEKDASDDEKAINEINSGIYCIGHALLHHYLPKLTNNNAGGEYYLTDVINLAAADGITIGTQAPEFAFEIAGVNDRKQLADLERHYQAHLVAQLQKQGVQFADPARVDIRGTLHAGKDVFIDIGCIFSGEVTLGDGVSIDANNVISSSSLGAHCHIKPNCVIDSSRLGTGVIVGPFAHLRPQTLIGDGGKIGNFVESKKSTIGTGSKINHLSYVGDATIGDGVNIGAGTITCNYDGINKWQTVIGSGAFIGSNSSLVAPINIGKHATIGAGSVITEDVPSATLALGRSRQTIIANWTQSDKTNTKPPQ